MLFLAASTTFEESYRAGLQALQQNHLADAQANLEAAAKLAPQQANVWLALAQTYRKLQEPEKAGEAAERVAGLASGNAQTLRLLAMFYSDAGQWLKAGDAHLAYAVSDREAVPRAMECYLRARAPERAIRAGTGSSGWEERAEIRNLLGKAYSESGRAELAANEFQASIRLKPYDEGYYFDFVNRLLQEQKFDAAIQVIQDAKHKFDKSAQLELALGVACYGLRRYAEAAAAFQRTIELSPDVEQPYVFLGKMMDQLPAQVPELARLFEAFEKAHAENYVGYLLHAKALVAQSSDAVLAEKLLGKAAALNPQAAEPHFQLGVLLQRGHRFAEAAAAFERAAALEPGDAATHYRLAQLYDRLGKHDAAVAERERHTQLVDANGK